MDIAIYGLGVMGASLAKNLISKGVPTVLFGKTEKERSDFCASEGEYKVVDTEEDMVKSLKSPRKIFLMVTAGKPVDEVINRLVPLLDKGDIIIDGGNSFFKDTQRRYQSLEEQGILFLGVGVSGGEQGALLGPSMMVGGSLLAWECCKDILQKIAARTSTHICCQYLGEGGVGHFVKMVHNGIEYAIMQVIADIYSVMDRGLRLTHQETYRLFTSWRNSDISSYLIEIVADIIDKADTDGSYLLDNISDVASQKGTGNWTVEQGIEHKAYIPSITEAVFTRYFSHEKELRRKGSKALNFVGETAMISKYDEVLEHALYMSMLICYSQGFELLKKASDEYKWNLDLSLVASVWEEGCIIRSKMLADIKEALKEGKHLLLTSKFADKLKFESSLREIAIAIVKIGLAAPTYLSTLSYYDCCRKSHMNTNLIQAMRDYFGAHTYERVDKKGSFHTEWI